MGKANFIISSRMILFLIKIKNIQINQSKNVILQKLFFKVKLNI